MIVCYIRKQIGHLIRLLVVAMTLIQIVSAASIDEDKEFYFSKKHPGYDKYANDCLKKSYTDAIGESKKEITQKREDDLDYVSYFELTCCCSFNIISLFRKKTKSMTHDRVNPAVDKLIKSLRNQRISSDIKIQKLVHLKYINAIYSFYDEDGAAQRNQVLTMPKDDKDGCLDEIKFKILKDENLKRKDEYRRGLLEDMLGVLHAFKNSAKIISQKNSMKMVE